LVPLKKATTVDPIPLFIQNLQILARMLKYIGFRKFLLQHGKWNIARLGI